ncbi:ArnT family glycosyltransferase [Bellilinea sp.]|jgi:4-amino-4-deoxy-L-arabinose transferase-like glycosyltransferase
MSKNFQTNAPLIFIIFLFSILYFLGINEVPFHPDESTQIFMSRDVQIFLSQPSLLFYNPDHPEYLRQKYRLIDPPLSRWVIGIAQLIFNLPPLPSDWDWSRTWEENLQNGALPSKDNLFISRLSVSFVFPLLLFLAFRTGERIGGKSTAWLNLTFTATNALILLHTRRAMAESLLLFFTSLSIYFFIKEKKSAWVTACFVALAFNAKYSAAPLFLAGLIGCLLIPIKLRVPIRQILKSVVLYSIIFVLITLLLNPVLWSTPFEAIKAAFTERQSLLFAQTAAIGGYNPAQTPQTIPARLLAFIAQVYIAPPAIADVGNYLAATETQTKIYFSRPWNNLTNGFFIGGFFFALSLIGLIWMIRDAWRSRQELDNPVILLLITFALQLAGIVTGIPLSFQRYYIPLLPFLTIFMAFAITSGIHLSVNSAKSKKW